MATLAQLTGRLERLRGIRANGLKSLAHGDVRSEFASMDDVTRAIGFVEQEIALACGFQQPRTFKVTSSKNL